MMNVKRTTRTTLLLLLLLLLVDLRASGHANQSQRLAKLEAARLSSSSKRNSSSSSLASSSSVNSSSQGGLPMSPTTGHPHLNSRARAVMFRANHFLPRLLLFLLKGPDDDENVLPRLTILPVPSRLQTTPILPHPLIQWVNSHPLTLETLTSHWSRLRSLNLANQRLATRVAPPISTQMLTIVKGA